MAAPAWNTNLTTFYLEGASTVTALGGGASGISNPETDYFIQGVNCISKAAWTNAIKGFIIDGLGANFTVPTDGAIIFFAKYDAAGSLDTKTNGGFQSVIGSANNAYYHYYIGGSNTLAFSSWVPYVIDPNIATADNTTGAPSGAERWVGILANLPTTSGPTKGNPIAIDAIRYGRCDIEYINGDLANGYNNFLSGETYANDSTRRWGVIQFENGAYLIQGFHSFGTVATSVDFRDSNKVVYWRASGNNNLSNNSVSTAFNRIEILNSGSIVIWDNIIIQSLGTRARGVFVHTAGGFTGTTCQFVDMDTFSFLSTTIATDCVFRRTNTITAPGSTLTNSSILTPTVANDESGLVWDVATNPSGYLDGMTFSKGTNAHHAITFGTSSPTSITLNNWTTLGFNSSNGQNDSTFKILRTSGVVTINIVGGSGNFTYETSGATVNIVIDPVTTLVTVTDIDTTAAIENARVLVYAYSGGSGNYRDSVSITRTGSVATVTHTGHGLIDGDLVLIENADQIEYEGVHTISGVTTNTYDYIVSGSPTSPATGTILSTTVYINGITDINGKISDTRSFSTNQPIRGKVRRATSGILYKSSPIVATIDNSNGVDISVQMISDE